MKKFNYIASAKRTFKIESNAINSLANQINTNFTQLCDSIRLSKGKFIIMGVGKSGHIGQKISATLSSTGTGSIFIHPTEAAHGDMGLIEKKDIIFLISAGANQQGVEDRSQRGNHALSNWLVCSCRTVRHHLSANTGLV